MRGLFLSEGRGGGETGKGEKAKGREVEMAWRDGFGPPKNFGVAPLTPVASWYGEGNGREGEEQKGRRGAESRKMGRKESWNRAVDWLRPALVSYNSMRYRH